MLAARQILIRGWECCKEGKYEEAIDWVKRSLTICRKNEDQDGIAKCYVFFGEFYQELEKYSEAIDYYKRSLGIFIEINDHEGIARCNEGLGNCYFDLNNYSEAVSTYEQSLSSIINNNLDKRLEEHVCYQLGIALMNMNRYQDSKQYLDEALIIAEQNGGNRVLESRCNSYLSKLSGRLCEYDSAVKYANRALSIANEIDSPEEKDDANGSLGYALLDVGRAKEAIWYFECNLKYAQETRDRNREIKALLNLSLYYTLIHNYDGAISVAEECLTIAKETGDMKIAYKAFNSIGSALKEKGKVKEAIEYHNKCLQYAIQFNDKHDQSVANNNLGTAYMELCKHYKAIEYLQTSLKLYSEQGIVIASCISAYNNLGALYNDIGNYQQAAKYLELSLSLSKEPRREVSVCYNLSRVYSALNKLELSRECLLKGIILGIQTEGMIGNVRYFQQLGDSFRKNAQPYKAIFYHNKALKLAQNIQNSSLIGECYILLAETCALLGQIDETIEFYEMALKTFVDSGNLKMKAECCYKIACVTYLVKPIPINEFIKEAETYFNKALQCYEEIFADLKEKHDLKITIVDTYIKAYKALALLLIETGRPSEALLVCDRGRACTLRDTLVSRYDMQHNQLLVDDISFRNPLKEEDIQHLLSSDSSLLFLAILEDNVHSWILSQNSSLTYVQNESSENNVLPNVAEIIDYIIKQPTSDKFLQSRLAKLLKKLFQHLITPIKDDLIEDEVVIFSEGNLYMVPFAALQDPQTGRYFCESKRIRIVPSLTTLKILKQCPSDYHSSNGALVVGNPSVGEVIFRGERMIFSSLEAAETEASVFASILNVIPLTGSSATKDVVKEKLKEGAAVIHIAAHGDNTTGEIVLAPSASAQTKAIPEEEDYILTMQEVQEIGVRAKLVVLSCCHTGRGEIRAEGVIGMARAFLAAGARAVVASLWAISDQATLDFMSGFYYHLRIGESASKSLNESMKELIRENKYSHPKYWAPFVLIGDDVTIF